MEPDPPVPISAVLDTGAGDYTITFDQPLIDPLPTGVDAGLRLSNTRLTYLNWAISASGDGIVATLADASVDAGPDMAWLTAPPTGVRALDGTPAESFTGYPLTVV